MGLGDRTARRHETEGSRRTAGVTPEDYWAFKPGEPVLTCDGFTGRVTAVYDGLGGDSDYEVVLDNNMGGGIYREGQLTSASYATSSLTENTAAKDYPELAEILHTRPDPGKYPESTLGMIASLQTEAATANCAVCGTSFYKGDAFGGGGSQPLLDFCPQHANTTSASPSIPPHLRGQSSLQFRAAYEGLSNAELAAEMKRLQGAGPNMEHSREALVEEIRNRGLNVDDVLQATAAYYTADELREIGRAEAERQGRSAEEILSSQAAVGGPPGLCDNGHLTWGGDCPSCGNAGDSNAMVVNDGDHRPQNVENTRNAVLHTAGTGDWHPWSSLCEEDPEEQGYCAYHRDWHDEPRTDCIEHDHDDLDDGPEDEPAEAMVHCQNCGQWKGKFSGHHPGNDGPCPNQAKTEDEVFDSLDPSKYCGEHCQSGHAADIVQGVGGHHTFSVGEPEYAGHGTSLHNETGPYDAPAERDSRYEVRDPDAQGLCHYCRAPLPDSPLRVLDDLGSPSERHFLMTNPTGPTKYSALDNAFVVLADAGRDPEMRFQVTASWRDVRDKARRIRSEGHVHIEEAKNGFIVAQVKGDHGTYESVLMRAPGTQKVAQWDCGCTWAKYHWGAPDDTSRFAGRMCSHALALHFEAQARGMFGRDIGTDTGVPRWLNQGDFAITSSLDSEMLPIQALAYHLVASGEDADEVALLCAVQASVNSPFGEPGPNTPMQLPGPTMPKDPSANPASAGFLTAADPPSWGQSGIPGMDRAASLDDALFEPEMPHTAGPALLLLPELIEGGAAAAEVGGAGAAAEGAGAAGAAEGEAASGVSRMQQAKDTFNTVKDKTAPARDLYRKTLPAREVAKGLGGNQQQSPSSGSAFTPSGPSFDSNDPSASDSASDLARRRQAAAEAAAATLHDEPEPALPSTDGAAEDDPRDAAIERARHGEFGYQGGMDMFASHGIPTGNEYSLPTNDVGVSSGGSAAPGLALKDADDDSLSPEDSSIQTVGSAGSVADIVAAFQASQGAQTLQAGPGAGDSSDIAAAAREFLAKTAMADFSPAEQQEIINEGSGGHVTAANLDRLQIEGTHYEALDRALAGIDDEDDEVWTA